MYIFPVRENSSNRISHFDRDKTADIALERFFMLTKSTKKSRAPEKKEKTKVSRMSNYATFGKDFFGECLVPEVVLMCNKEKNAYAFDFFTFSNFTV